MKYAEKTRPQSSVSFVEKHSARSATATSTRLENVVAESLQVRFLSATPAAPFLRDIKYIKYISFRNLV